MAEFFHGVRTTQKSTSVSTPVTVESGIPFVVGTAPVHTVGGKVNTPILCNTYEDAVSALGYSDDWENYTLCEMVYSHFRLFGVSPLVVVNVLDPKTHKMKNDATPIPVVEMQAKLPYDAIKESVKIMSEDGATAYTAGIDYDAFYKDDALIVEIIEGGAIPIDTAALSIEYDVVLPIAVKKSDIIGGFDVNTKTYSGLELIDQVFPKYLVIPDLLLAPGWTEDSEVAAILAAKAENINGLFKGHSLIDANCTDVRHYTDVPAWRADKNLYSETHIVLWPMIQLAERRFHMSVQAASLMAKVDSENGCPYESPSNKNFQMDATVLADGTEVVLDLTQANYLNSTGICTALNFIGGFVMWGNFTACYPSSADVKDYFIPVSRMFNWIGNTLILTWWKKTDKPMVRRLLDNVVETVNIWLNGLTADQKFYGGRVEVNDSENPQTDLMAGIIRFHLYITPPAPAQEIDFILEYDPSYVKAALAA